MLLEYQILLAVALDLAFGDPRWFPHPVKYIGRFALWIEPFCRRAFNNPRIAGVVEAFAVVGCTVVFGYGLLWGADVMHPLVGDLVRILILYTCLAARDLLKHSTDVRSALEAGDLTEAARRVGMICGRDTDRLDEPGIIRATVESVAENLADGVTAPLFYAAIGGPLGILAYKAVSTLDSTFGYENEEYARFGWASARLDDLANFLPARLTALLVPLAALIVGLRPISSLQVFVRDRLKHPSPNSGHTESAFAGALGIRLGGLSYYGGVPSFKEQLGDPVFREESRHIQQANVLMVATSALMLLFLLCVRAIV